MYDGGVFALSLMDKGGCWFVSLYRLSQVDDVVGTHSDVISQLHGAVLTLIGQVDTVQVLRKESFMSSPTG